MKLILRNRAKCLLCGDAIESFNRHDFKPCSCGAIIVDGGCDYLRRKGNKDTFQDANVIIDTENYEFEIIREHLLWGTYGIDGDEPLHYVALRDMDTEHIENVISMFDDTLPKFRKLMMERELSERMAL